VCLSQSAWRAFSIRYASIPQGLRSRSDKNVPVDRRLPWRVIPARALTALAAADVRPADTVAMRSSSGQGSGVLNELGFVP
jgi:hypothetical protein